MSRATIAIATITLARDPAEEALLRASIAALANLGLPVSVADGGSGEAFLRFVGSMTGVALVTPNKAGLVPQVGAAIAAAGATGADYILYTESDKLAFFGGPLSAFVETAGELVANADPGASTTASKVAVVLAARTPATFATFPRLQQYTESTINGLCGEVTGISGDYSYGPFLMHRSLLPWIARLPDDLGWGWRPFMFAIAARSGQQIRHVPGDFACPDDQRGEDDGDRLHRVRQLAQNVRGLQHALEVTL